MRVKTEISIGSGLRTPFAKTVSADRRPGAVFIIINIKK